MNPASADTSRRIGYFTAASFLIFLLIVSLIVPVNFTFAQSQTAAEEKQFPQSIIASSSRDTTPHLLKLRAIQDGDNAEPKKVSGFKLDMTNVVAAQINTQVLVFVTDSSVKVSEAKVRTVSDQLIDLVPSSQANAFSLANLPVGVYTLDVMTQKGNTKAAYEGILVLGQEPINPQTQTIIERQIVREEQDDGDNGDNGDNGDDGDCDPSYPDDCIPSPPPDLDCGDPGVPNNFKVIGSDPHGFDRDNDGMGCESNSSNGGNNEDDNEDEDGRGECIEDNGYSLSEGSYIDEDNNAIVGSPCDPEEFCEDEGSIDPVVIDFCDDIWDDVDEEPPEECPPGTTGTPPDCVPIICLDNPDAEECPPPIQPGPCDTDNPPDFCDDPPVCIDPSCAPTECPDGRIVPAGQSCDDEDDDKEENEGETTPPEEIPGEVDGEGEEGEGGDGDNGDSGEEDGGDEGEGGDEVGDGGDEEGEEEGSEEEGGESGSQ